MAKFIIEVSNGYIRERADVNNILENLENEESTLCSSMIDLIAFSHVKHQIEDGNDEFYISSETFINSDVVPRGLFNQLVALCASTTVAKEIETLKLQENKK